MHRRWLSLPLLSSCASAFYPYHVQEGGDRPGKRFIPLDLEPKSKDDSGIVTLDIKKMVQSGCPLFHYMANLTRSGETTCFQW
jgi:hypothetical protein